MAMRQQEIEQDAENSSLNFFKEWGLPLALAASVGTYCIYYPDSVTKGLKCIKEVPLPLSGLALLTSGYFIANAISNNRRIALLAKKQNELAKKLENHKLLFETHLTDVTATLPLVAQRLSIIYKDLETLCAIQKYTTIEQFALRITLDWQLSEVKKQLCTVQEQQKGLIALDNLY